MATEPVWIESVTGDSLLFMRRDDGGLYVETRGVSCPTVSLVIDKDEADVLKAWLTPAVPICAVCRAAGESSQHMHQH